MNLFLEHILWFGWCTKHRLATVVTGCKRLLVKSLLLAAVFHYFDITIFHYYCLSGINISISNQNETLHFNI